MLEQQIYQLRFKEKEQRNTLWKTLINSFFQQYINPDDVVLDIPAGYCEFINNINCSKKIAVDINPDTKKYIAKDVNFLKCSSTKILLPSSSVNKIFVSNFFEHLTKEDTIKTIKEFYRILKKGGKVLILQPNIRFSSNDYWMFFDHITPVDDRALDEIFTALQFSVDKKIVKFLPFSAKSRYPKHPLLIKLYLAIPLVWKILGQQSFLVYEK